jgi:SAM-dependent methyltransferase
MNPAKTLKPESSPPEDSMGQLLPDASQLDDFYFVTPSGSCYRPDPDAPTMWSQPVIASEAGKENWEGIARSYKSRLNAANGPVLVLDAGDGELMDALRRQGLLAIGCEPSARRTQRARRKYGFDEHIFRCSEAEPFLKWLNRVGRKVQAVFLCHTLEQVPDPKALWRDLANILDEDGLVIAQVAEEIAVTGPGMAKQNALVRTAAECGWGLKNVDCNFENSFNALVFKKISCHSKFKPVALNNASASGHLASGFTVPN